MEKVSLVDAARLHRDLSEMWNADIADIIDNKTGAYKPIGDWPPIWRRMTRGIDVQELFKRSEDGKQSGSYGWDKIGQVLKVRFTEISKLAELLGRHKDVDAFVAQRIEGKVELDIRVEQMTARLQAGRERIRMLTEQQDPQPMDSNGQS